MSSRKRQLVVTAAVVEKTTGAQLLATVHKPQSRQPEIRRMEINPSKFKRVDLPSN